MNIPTETSALLALPTQQNLMMNRSTTFATPARQHLVRNPEAQLKQEHVRGPLPFLNPTSALFDLKSRKKDPNAAAAQQLDGPSSINETGSDAPGEAQVAWRSRDNRKGRHVLVVPKRPASVETPRRTDTWAAVAKGIWRMCTVFAWWDVSWWIGVLFSVGSAIFVACGFFYWLPLAYPGTAFGGEGLAGGLTSLIGATLFQAGAILLIFEACNENQSGCFGWALQHAFSHDSSSDEGSPSGENAKLKTTTTDTCDHHHVHGIHRKKTLHAQHPQASRKWEWWPSWEEVRGHYIHEIGWLASIVMSIGATIFYVAGIMALPQIYSQLSQGVLWGVYWLTYLVGGTLFVVSSAFYMLETQPNWYTPAPRLLGWWIGTFNMIGSVGWTLSASFGYCSQHWCEYQSDLSLLWASVAFLIGSLLLWYEALDKYPVEVAH